MAQRNRSRKASRFAQLPHSLLDSPDYINLSGNAIKLLIELLKQYNGFNNGDLSPSYTLMSTRGFKSKATLHSKIQELLNANMIELTRTGGKNRASLYALTWLPIDECPRKRLEIGPTKHAARNFALENHQTRSRQK